MSTTARKNVKTSTRYNDTMTVNDWLITFEYETVDGVLGDRIAASATKDGASMYISSANGNVSVNFNNGAYEIDVANSVVDEINNIKNQTF